MNLPTHWVSTLQKAPNNKSKIGQLYLHLKCLQKGLIQTRSKLTKNDKRVLLEDTDRSRRAQLEHLDPAVSEETIFRMNYVLKAFRYERRNQHTVIFPADWQAEKRSAFLSALLTDLRDQRTLCLTSPWETGSILVSLDENENEQFNFEFPVSMSSHESQTQFLVEFTEQLTDSGSIETAESLEHERVEIKLRIPTRPSPEMQRLQNLDMFSFTKRKKVHTLDDLRLGRV